MSDKTVIIQLISNKAWGGGEAYAAHLAVQCQRAGYDSHIVVRPIKRVVEQLQRTHLPLHFIRLGELPILKSAVQLSQLIKQYDRVVLHTHNFKVAFIAVLARSLSHHPHCRIVMTRHLVRKGKNTPHYQWLYRHLDHIIFTSHLVERTFLSSLKHFPTPSSVVYNGIDIPSFSSLPSLHTTYHLPLDAPLLMAHGRISKEKGIEVLIRALAQLPTAILCLIGTGDSQYIAYLKSIALELHLEQRILWLGFLSSPYPYLAQATIGVVPSIVPEAFSLSTVEYMALGKSVVTTHIGAQKEIIENHVNGLLVDANNADALASALKGLIDDKEKRETIGRNARQRVQEHFTYEHFWHSLNKIYQQYTD